MMRSSHHVVICTLVMLAMLNFGVLRMFKVIATSGFLTTLECTKFVFGRGGQPLTPLGELTALSQTL